MLFHLGGCIAKYFGIIAFSIPFSFGHVGVEFFFVLSGFIILHAHRNDIFQPHKLVGYLKKRFIRIYPTYWMIYLTVFFLAIISTALRNTVPHDFSTILKSLILIPQSSLPPVLAVAWTLSYEMLFYLFFACLILSRWLSIIATLSLTYIYLRYTGISESPFPLSFLSSNYILLFIMGMIISIVCQSKKDIFNNKLFYLPIGVIGLMMAVFLISYTFEDKHNILAGEVDPLKTYGTLLYGVTSSFLILSLVKIEDSGYVIGESCYLQILGNSSYALYLIHFPLISILSKLSILIHLDKLGFIGGMISSIVIFSSCLIISVVFHQWIEKPVISYYQNDRINKKLVLGG